MTFIDFATTVHSITLFYALLETSALLWLRACSRTSTPPARGLAQARDEEPADDILRPRDEELYPELDEEEPGSYMHYKGYSDVCRATCERHDPCEVCGSPSEYVDGHMFPKYTCNCWDVCLICDDPRYSHDKTVRHTGRYKDRYYYSLVEAFNTTHEWKYAEQLLAYKYGVDDELDPESVEERALEVEEPADDILRPRDEDLYPELEEECEPDEELLVSDLLRPRDKDLYPEEEEERDLDEEDRKLLEEVAPMIPEINRMCAELLLAELVRARTPY